MAFRKNKNNKNSFRTRHEDKPKRQAKPVYVDSDREAEILSSFLSNPDLALKMIGKGYYRTIALVRSAKEGKVRLDKTVQSTIYSEFKELAGVYQINLDEAVEQALALWCRLQIYQIVLNSNEIKLFLTSSCKHEMVQILEKNSAISKFDFMHMHLTGVKIFSR